MAVTRKRKKSPAYRKYIIVALFITALSLAGSLIYRWWDERQSGFAHYPGFGIPLPLGFEIHGIDVSHHQSRIHWASVSAMEEKSVRLGFVFIKATEGYTRKDSQFPRNWRKAREAGLARGAYHFFLPNKDGGIQAENFIQAVRLQTGDLPPVLDVEETFGVRPADLRKRVSDWLVRVERHYGVRPIIYTSADFYTRILGSEFDDYPLWVAHYLQRDKPRVSRPWSFWQHSETGRVNGITTKVDFNVFSGDSADFKSLLVP